MPALVPLDRRLVHVVPGELVDQEERRERDELVERRVERVDMVEDPSRNRGVERLRFLELLERRAPIRRLGRCVGIDREHVVARRHERPGDPSLGPAPNL